MKTILLTLLALALACPPAFCQALPPDVHELPATLSSPTKVRDLGVLGRVWGFLKYHHPAVTKGAYNWDEELVRMIAPVLHASTAEERNRLLLDWVERLGPVPPQALPAPDTMPVKLYPDLGWINTETLGDALAGKLRLIQKAKRDSVSHYVEYAPAENPRFKNEEPYAAAPYPVTKLRLLALFRYWNMIQYYFPYRELMDKPWSGVLEEFIPRFWEAQNELQYKLALLTLIGQVQDTHANISSRDPAIGAFRGRNQTALYLAYVEDKVVVAGYRDEKLGLQTGLRKGDIIERVNGKPVALLLQERLPYLPASNYTTQLKDFARDLLCTNDTVVSVSYTRDAVTRTDTIPCYSPLQVTFPSLAQRKDTCFRFLAPDIAYLYPGSLRSAYLPRLMTQAKKTKGLIIDLRCYPLEFVVFTLGSYLMPAPTPFVKFSKLSLQTPGLFTVTEPLKVGWYNPNYYKGKVVILVNEITLSQAEYTAMAFRVAPNAIVVGSTTAGADGNVSPIELPGGIRTIISGIGIYYPDGRETQRIGIIPDVEVKPTIKGLSENRDEVLEKAVELIRGQ